MLIAITPEQFNKCNLLIKLYPKQKKYTEFRDNTQNDYDIDEKSDVSEPKRAGGALAHTVCNLKFSGAETACSSEQLQKSRFISNFDEKQFTRLMYSSSCCTLNCVCIIVPFIVREHQEDKFNFRGASAHVVLPCSEGASSKLTFNVYENETTIIQLRQIELDILQLYQRRTTKKFEQNLFNQLKTGEITYVGFGEVPNTGKSVLKIMGIWESDAKFGLVFKFLMQT